jgi:hypothetical protein
MGKLKQGVTGDGQIRRFKELGQASVVIIEYIYTREVDIMER